MDGSRRPQERDDPARLVERPGDPVDPARRAVWPPDVWWIYGVTFIQSTIFIAFSSGEFAAIPSLVSTDDLVTANGRIQATYSAAQVVGPLLAGALISFLPLTWVLAFDAGSFALSAVSLSLVRASFNVRSDEPKEATTILHDIREGLRYVLSIPVLRNISLMMALINFVGATTYAQTRALCRRPLTRKRQIGLLFAAGAPAWSSPACLQDVCGSASASRPSR